jgi:deoxyribodipyrimidine photo-lyase
VSTRSIVWFRRDLRISDHPALVAALSESDEIVPVFIIDSKLIERTGSNGLAYLAQSLQHLDASLDKKLQVIAGQPIDVLKKLQEKYNAQSVHISAEYEPVLSLIHI